MTPRLERVRDEVAEKLWSDVNINGRRIHFKSIYKEGFNDASAEWQKIVEPLVNALDTWQAYEQSTIDKEGPYSSSSKIPFYIEQARSALANYRKALEC